MRKSKMEEFVKKFKSDGFKVDRHPSGMATFSKREKDYVTEDGCIVMQLMHASIAIGKDEKP